MTDRVEGTLSMETAVVEMEEMRASTFAVTHRYMAELVPDPAWASWASSLVPTVAIEAVIAWLDAGQPDQASAPRRIGEAVAAVVEAARSQGDSDVPPALRP